MLTALAKRQLKTSPEANANPPHTQAGHQFSNVQQRGWINQVNYSQAAIINYDCITAIIHRHHPLSELTVLGKTIYLVIE